MVNRPINSCADLPPGFQFCLLEGSVLQPLCFDIGNVLSGASVPQLLCFNMAVGCMHDRLLN